MTRAKPFDIPKRDVWEAFKHVRANQGAAGVDGQSLQDFEVRLADNLYKLRNRLSSGSYMPPPVRRVDIPKASGGTRSLGIPTVADRIAQEVVRRRLEPLVEPLFHADSYGYRPGRAAIDAIRTARQRCWRYDWVLDLDIKGFFDSIDWTLLLKPAEAGSPPDVSRDEGSISCTFVGFHCCVRCSSWPVLPPQRCPPPWRTRIRSATPSCNRWSSRRAPVEHVQQYTAPCAEEVVTYQEIIAHQGISPKWHKT